jgi:hypothetical protein
LKCGRKGQYRKKKLIERYGADIRLPDFRQEIGQCKRHGQMHDACIVVTLIWCLNVSRKIVCVEAARACRWDRPGCTLCHHIADALIAAANCSELLNSKLATTIPPRKQMQIAAITVSPEVASDSDFFFVAGVPVRVVMVFPLELSTGVNSTRERDCFV